MYCNCACLHNLSYNPKNNKKEKNSTYLNLQCIIYTCCCLPFPALCVSCCRFSTESFFRLSVPSNPWFSYLIVIQLDIKSINWHNSSLKEIQRAWFDEADTTERIHASAASVTFRVKQSKTDADMCLLCKKLWIRVSYATHGHAVYPWKSRFSGFRCGTGCRVCLE